MANEIYLKSWWGTGACNVLGWGLIYKPYVTCVPELPYLLDDYSGASVAYSLRKLSSSTTNVVRVRRSSDNTEQNFTANQITDGTLTTFTGANDGFVTIWYDQSSNNNNAVQITAINQPILVSSGIIELVNNKPCLELDDAVEKHFIISNSLTGSETIFLVNKKINENGNKYIYDSNIADDPNGTNRNYAITTGVNFQIQNEKNIYFNGLLVTSADLSAQNLLMINLNSNSNEIGTLFSRFNIRENYPGRMQEIIIYPTDQTGNRTGIETNINNNYNIYSDYMLLGDTGFLLQEDTGKIIL
jgi:hypothetical protein